MTSFLQHRCQSLPIDVLYNIHTKSQRCQVLSWPHTVVQHVLSFTFCFYLPATRVLKNQSIKDGFVFCFFQINIKEHRDVVGRFRKGCRNIRTRHFIICTCSSEFFFNQLQRKTLTQKIHQGNGKPYLLAKWNLEILQNYRLLFCWIRIDHSSWWNNHSKVPISICSAFWCLFWTSISRLHHISVPKYIKSVPFE